MADEQPRQLNQSDAPAETMRTVTGLTAQKKNARRYNLALDGKFAFGVSEETVIHFLLTKGKKLTEADVAEIQAYEAEQKLYEYALNSLSQAAKTRHELQQRLLKKAEATQMVARVLDRLTKIGVLDDRLYAESYVRGAIESHKGPKTIRYALKRKGVAQEDIDAALQQYAPDTEQANANALAEKKFNTYNKTSSKKNSLQKTYRFLMQKGFSKDAIQSALKPLEESEADTEQEQALMEKDLKKYARKYRDLDASERNYRIKQQLLKKGYAYDAIESTLSGWEDERD